MVFDIPEMMVLRERYKDELSFRVPNVVFLDRYDGCQQERELIEKLACDLPPEKLNSWIGNFINIDRRQHIGAWFEIMVYGWLKSNFLVQVEPEINGKLPDFLIEGENIKILVESIAYLYSKEELQECLLSSEFIYLLETIEKPFAVNIKPVKYGNRLNRQDFMTQVTYWLDNTYSEPLQYEDNFGNILELKVAYKSRARKIGVMDCGDGFQIVDTDQIKKPLSQKTKHHRKLQDNTYPYVIAIYLESWQYDANDVITAWFGKTQTVFDPKTGKIHGERNDLSGLAYHGRTVRNRGISGILVFKRTPYPYGGEPLLNTWYIENPYARNKIDTRLFPVDGLFAVISNNQEYGQMDWIGLRP